MLDQLFADAQNKKQEVPGVQQQVWQRIRARTRMVSGCKVVQSGLNVHEIFIHVLQKTSI
jgi:hypothetical protein